MISNYTSGAKVVRTCLIKLMYVFFFVVQIVNVGVETGNNMVLPKWNKKDIDI